MKILLKKDEVRMKILLKKDFKGHRGRPGKVGGSVARGGVASQSSNDSPQTLAKRLISQLGKFPLGSPDVRGSNTLAQFTTGNSRYGKFQTSLSNEGYQRVDTSGRTSFAHSDEYRKPGSNLGIFVDSIGRDLFRVTVEDLGFTSD